MNNDLIMCIAGGLLGAYSMNYIAKQDWWIFMRVLFIVGCALYLGVL